MASRIDINRVYEYLGTSSDQKPTLDENGNYLPTGCKWTDVNNGRVYYYDGVGTWGTVNKPYSLGNRTSISITTTSSHLFSGGAIERYGDLLRQYTIELGNSTNDPTRTMSILDSNLVTVWASTAIVDSTSITRLLPTSEQVILSGTYTIVWTLSTNSATTGITDYFTLGFQRW